MLDGSRSLKFLLGHLKHDRQSLLDCVRNPGTHLRDGVPVVGAHGAAVLLAGAAGASWPIRSGDYSATCRRRRRPPLSPAEGSSSTLSVAGAMNSLSAPDPSTGPSSSP